MVELKSPDLWGMQSDPKFHARPANDGPEAVWAQFGGWTGHKRIFAKL